VKIKKLLLDTTYLLPLFKIEISGFSSEDLEALLNSGIDLYYNPVSLIEVKWVILRLTKRKGSKLKELRSIYSETIEYLLTSDEIKRTIMINGEISRLEDELYDMGLRDFFDRIIVATAKVFTGNLLTEDKEIIEALKNIEKFKDLRIITWKQLSKEVIK